jgi:UMF1 family MFS transporter
MIRAMKNKKEIFGWAMFDFANSAYTTNIVTVIFANYFVQGIVQGEGGKTLWGVGITISNILIIFSAPIIGAIGDFSSCRKKFLVVTCLLCVIGTAGLFFATPGAVALAIVLFVVSNYFFQISESICSSFLPDLAEPKELGKISGLGWSLGYVGGLVGLLLCFPLVGSDFGPENAWNLRLTNLVTAATFLVAAIPTFVFLKEHRPGQILPEGTSYIGMGFQRVRNTLTHLKQLRDLSLFLVVFLLMSVALTTVFSFSTIYSSEEMGFSVKDLMVLFIVVQISAAAGAFSFGYIQDRIGLRFSIQILLLVWSGILVGIFFTYSVQVFWVLVLLLGAGLGSIQSAARAMVGYLAPASKRAEIFGFWSLTYKMGGLVGPLMYGVIADNLSHRAAMLFVSSFYILAFLLNLKVDEERGHEAGNEFERKYAL